METRNENLIVSVEPVVLPNQLNCELPFDKTHLAPTPPTLTEKRPPSPDEGFHAAKREVDSNQSSVRFLSKGMYGAVTMVQSYGADTKVLEDQKNWEQVQAEDVSRRSSLHEKSAVPTLKGLEQLKTASSENKENAVPLLDRARSIKKKRSNVEDCPEFDEPTPRRPSQSHSRKLSSHALIMQSIPAKTAAGSAESLSPVISPVAKATSLSGPASPTLTKPILSGTSYTGFPISGQQSPTLVQNDQKPIVQITSSSPCCVLL